MALLLFVATTYEVVAIYQTPPSHLAEAKMMLAGKLSSSPTPPPAADPSPVAGIALLTALLIAVYSPSILLLLFAILFRRSKYLGPPTI